MNPVYALLLGAVQGATEFLPVSSSGHLVIFQHLFGFTQPALIFDVSVHAGTLLAVIIFFRTEILGLLAAVVPGGDGLTAGPEKQARRRMVWLIIAGSVPTALIGLGLKPVAEGLFSSPVLAGAMLMVTAVFLWLTQKARAVREKGREKMTLVDALVVGLVQGMAILPGISRSGATISAGLFLGVRRQVAARYSFLLSIPAILGAELLSLADAPSVFAALTDPAIVLGTAAAFVVGFFCLGLLMKMVEKGRLHAFAPYCALLGAAVLVFHALS